MGPQDRAEHLGGTGGEAKDPDAWNGQVRLSSTKPDPSSSQAGTRGRNAGSASRRPRT